MSCSLRLPFVFLAKHQSTEVIGSGADIGTQATAAKDYVTDKKDQKSHEVCKAYNDDSLLF